MPQSIQEAGTGGNDSIESASEQLRFLLVRPSAPPPLPLPHTNPAIQQVKNLRWGRFSMEG
jgi:hypothetical protein